MFTGFDENDPKLEGFALNKHPGMKRVLKQEAKAAKKQAEAKEKMGLQLKKLEQQKKKMVVQSVRAEAAPTTPCAGTCIATTILSSGAQTPAKLHTNRMAQQSNKIKYLKPKTSQPEPVEGEITPCV